MAHCLDVISCGSSKSMHNSLFSLYSIMPWFSLVGFIGYIKLKTVKDNPEKTPGKKTTTPFSYINDVSVDLDKVCLHITYLFLKKLTVGDVSAIVFLLALVSHENLYSLPEAVWRVFSKESTPLVVQQSPLPGEFHIDLSLYFICLFILLILLTLFFLQPLALEPSFTDSVFRIPFPFLFPFLFQWYRFPDSEFLVWVLPWGHAKQCMTPYMKIIIIKT